LVNNRVSLAVAVLITLVWASACVWAFAVDPTMVQLVTVITPVMLAATGFLFAQPILEARRRSRRENGHPGPPTPAPERE
jgi:hypothetical protein